jgi:glycosidase
VTGTLLDAGDPNCPYGGTAFVSATGVTYACNGVPGAAGVSPQVSETPLDGGDRNCPSGGFQIVVYTPAADGGTGTTQTAYACNGGTAPQWKGGSQEAGADSSSAPTAASWSNAVIYEVLIDRFLDGDPTNDSPPLPAVAPQANWMGGDLAGVLAEIDSGYFAQLGVNVLWLSSPVSNTTSAEMAPDGVHLIAPYRGAWAQDLHQVESAFGTMSDLQTVVSAAHAHGIRVLLDFPVADVASTSTEFATYPSYFTPLNIDAGECLCGSAVCPSTGVTATSCWVTDYLPHWDDGNASAQQLLADDSVWWLSTSGADGLRLDLADHVSAQLLAGLRAASYTTIEPSTGQHVLLLGQSLTSDASLIASRIDPTMLDGQLDFPLRAQVIDAILLRSTPMSTLDAFLSSNTGAYGAGLMGHFLGTPDLPRADGFAEDTPLWTDPWVNGEDRAWSNQPSLPTTASAFQRLATAYTLLFTIPGMPILYQGDEIAMFGAGEPDSAHLMQFGSLASGQLAVLDTVKKLGTVRKQHPALHDGSRTSLSSDADTMVYEMSDGTDTVYVAINRSDSSATVSSLPSSTLTDLINGGTVTGPSVVLGARAALVLSP